MKDMMEAPNARPNQPPIFAKIYIYDFIIKHTEIISNILRYYLVVLTQKVWESFLVHLILDIIKALVVEL